jgi:hypothetical protein
MNKSLLALVLSCGFLTCNNSPIDLKRPVKDFKLSVTTSGYYFMTIGETINIQDKSFELQKRNLFGFCEYGVDCFSLLNLDEEKEYYLGYTNDFYPINNECNLMARVIDIFSPEAVGIEIKPQKITLSEKTIFN